jgi:NADPH:quinone reductase-like Zn-dependent oxidoreductase
MKDRNEKLMKAIYQTEYGKSDVLQYGEQPTPVIKADEVRIKNHASSVNPRDWMIRSGRYQLQFLVPSFPLILGSDFAGEVLEIGSRVMGFKEGDKVFGMKNPSEGLATYAELVTAAEKSITLMPEGSSYIEAAGIPLCALTAWQALVQQGRMKKGMNILIIGASGGVGSFGVQIAKALGGKVTAVCSQTNESMVTRLGASEVVDYHQQDFLKANDCYDIVFDTIGRHNLTKCLPILNPGGSYISTIPSPSNLKAMVATKFTSLFSRNTKKAKIVMVKSAGSDLAEIAKLVSEGSLQPVIDQIFPIQQAAKAHDYSRSLRAKGKIILKIR